jgi:hypothetical protein
VGSISAGSGKKTVGRVVGICRVGHRPYLMEQPIYTIMCGLGDIWAKSNELVVIFEKEVVVGTPEILPSASSIAPHHLQWMLFHDPKPPCLDCGQLGGGKLAASLFKSELKAIIYMSMQESKSNTIKHTLGTSPNLD